MAKKPKIPKAMIVHNEPRSLWRRAVTFFTYKIKTALEVLKKEKTEEEIRIEKEKYHLLGDAYLKQGSPKKAFNAYIKAGAIIEVEPNKFAIKVSMDKFNKCGDLCIKKAKDAKKDLDSLPFLERAITSFKITKNKERLIECGQLLLEKGYTNRALKCFDNAASIPDQDTPS